MKTKIMLDQKLFNLGKVLKKEKHVIIITDTTVKRLYGKRFPKGDVIVIREGEDIKDMGTVYYIFKKMLDLGADRESFIVGIGGGIVCDIAGFVATIYMRGVHFGFVPTTLLAQVDASLGGKNGVNFEHYKNIVGAISQSEFVYYDFSVLKTLPEKELKSGYVEAVKHSIISGKPLNKKSIKDVVRDSIKTKLDIVKDDVSDHHKRRLLNLGHTLGHAIETVTKGKVSHGTAVSAGICFSARFSYCLGLLNKKEMDKIIIMVASVGLPTELPKGISKSKIIDAISKDKKKGQKQIEFALIKGFGKVVLKKLDIKLIGEAVNALC